MKNPAHSLGRVAGLGNRSLAAYGSELTTPLPLGETPALERAAKILGHRFRLTPAVAVATAALAYPALSTVEDCQ